MTMATLWRAVLLSVAAVLTWGWAPSDVATSPQHAETQNARTRTDGPFGTLREQAAVQHQWLRKRLDTFLAPLMRKHGIDMWVVPMREYTEDPIFAALSSPETFAARRGGRRHHRWAGQHPVGATAAGQIGSHSLMKNPYRGVAESRAGDWASSPRSLSRPWRVRRFGGSPAHQFTSLIHHSQ